MFLARPQPDLLPREKEQQSSVLGFASDHLESGEILGPLTAIEHLTGISYDQACAGKSIQLFLHRCQNVVPTTPNLT